MARSIYELNQVGYDSLAAAIVNRAVIDYRIARKHNDLLEVNAIRKFFLSDWCKMLCNIEGKTLIEMCESEYEEFLERKKHERNKK